MGKYLINPLLYFQIEADLHGGYEIYYFQQGSNGEYVSTPVGKWDRKSGKTDIRSDLITWYVHGYDSMTEGPVPESVCAKPCGVGEFYIQGELECCWECRRCRDNEVVRGDQQGCETCEIFTWPDQLNFTSCVNINPHYMKWSNAISIALVSLASVGLISCLAICLIFIKYTDRKIIKGSNRELTAFIILGLLLAYLTVFAFLSKPTDITCYLNYGGFHISCTLLFGPLCLKTLLLYRIFKAAEKLRQGIKLAGAPTQILLVTTMMMVQVKLN